jgi:hypothetical protein
LPARGGEAGAGRLTQCESTPQAEGRTEYA